MNNKLFKPKAILLIFCLTMLGAYNAKSEGTLIQLSSGTYDGGSYDYGYGVTADSNDNIFVGVTTFNTSYDFMILKYDNNLNLINSVTYDTGDPDSLRDIAVDNEDNVTATGAYRKGGTDYNFLTVQYDNNLTLISTATYDSGATGDWSYGVAVDKDQNIIITGYVHNTVDEDFYTIKYGKLKDFTATYDSGEDDRAYDITTDSNGNIFVTGLSDIGSDYDYYTIKYDKSLNTLATKIYDGGSSDTAEGITTDSKDNIIVTGDTNHGECLTIKYDNYLNVISSHCYSSDNSVYGNSVTTDNQDNIIVCGYHDDGSTYGILVLKYDKKMNLLSSFEYGNNGKDAKAHDISTDSHGNIFVICAFENANNDCCTIKFHGSPYISSVSPSKLHRGQTQDITLNGNNFLSGARIDFSGKGITVNSANVINSQQLTANVTVSQDAVMENKNITVTNPDECYTTNASAVEITEIDAQTGKVKVRGGEKGYVNPTKGDKARLVFKTSHSGKVKVKIFTKKGQLVWENEKYKTGGDNFIEWTCKNKDNTTVASGIYIAYIKGPGIEKTKKIAIVK